MGDASAPRHHERPAFVPRWLFTAALGLALVMGATGTAAAQGGAQSTVQVRVVIAERVETMAADELKPVVSSLERGSGGRAVSGTSGSGEYRVVVRRRATAGSASRVWVRDVAGRERELGSMTIVVADGITAEAASALALQLRSEGRSAPVELTYEVQARSGLSL